VMTCGGGGRAAVRPCCSDIPLDCLQEGKNDKSLSMHGSSRMVFMSYVLGW
jgi:hypothetical protein